LLNGKTGHSHLRNQVSLSPFNGIAGYFFNNGPLFLDRNTLFMKKSHPEGNEPSLFHDQKNMGTLPLSSRVRPRCLSEYIGQKHILGEGKLLTRAIAADRLISLILYGPPGTGKTSLAHCIGSQTRSHFEKLNAVGGTVEDVRRVLAASRNRVANGGTKTVLFIDEIHRFNKAQQDALMPDLEEGHVVLIGATVYNPVFSLIGPLRSRSLIFELKPLSEDEIIQVLDQALADLERGLGAFPIDCSRETKRFLARFCDGDARKALNALEIACMTAAVDAEGRVHVDMVDVEDSLQKKNILYDGQGDGHYDTVSAFIKSMRGSDPDASLYWLAKMIFAGEDPKFIARRICICASEDVGNADPQALLVANAAAQSAEAIGMPEARIILAQAAVYVACAPKSNAVYKGIDDALSYVRNNPTLAVPGHLKHSPSPGTDDSQSGQAYQYAHDYSMHYVIQEYMPETKTFYVPTEMGYEKKIKEWMNALRGEDIQKAKSP
jgi:putative ATPase